MRLTGMPEKIPHESIDLLTKERDPTAEPSPISTPGIITELAPIITCLLITTGSQIGVLNFLPTVGLVKLFPE